MLRPERREDPQLREGRGAAQHLEDAAVLQLIQVVLAHDLRRNRTFAGEGMGGSGPGGYAGVGHGERVWVTSQ